MDFRGENFYVVENQVLPKRQLFLRCLHHCNKVECSILIEASFCCLSDLWIKKYRLLIISWEETVFPYLPPIEPFSVISSACRFMWLQALPLLTFALKCFGFLQRKASWEYTSWKPKFHGFIYVNQADILSVLNHLYGLHRVAWGYSVPHNITIQKSTFTLPLPYTHIQPLDHPSVKYSWVQSTMTAY